MEDAEVVVLAYGCSARSSMRALKLARAQGLRAGMVRPTTLWPFPDKAVEKIAARGIPVLVPEMNLGQLVLEVERLAAGRFPVKRLSRVDGQLFTPDQILTALKGGF
jgi:2-oxoglutarate ferredoxin oxidoreductase subunit alpha